MKSLYELGMMLHASMILVSALVLSMDKQIGGATKAVFGVLLAVAIVSGAVMWDYVLWSPYADE